jgi:hypothetical protein
MPDRVERLVVVSVGHPAAGLGTGPGERAGVPITCGGSCLPGWRKGCCRRTTGGGSATGGGTVRSRTPIPTAPADRRCLPARSADRRPELVPRQRRPGRPIAQRPGFSGRRADRLSDNGGVVQRGPVPDRVTDNRVRTLRHRRLALRTADL